VNKVENRSLPISISSSGSLSAYNRLSLFSEVQGIFDWSAGNFKPGEYYKGGSTLLRINSQEFQANIRAQRGSFITQLVALLPDLRLDYPDVAPRWSAYLDSVDVSKAIPTLPEFSSDREKYFITGKGLLSSYYQIKNLEERLSKYRIRAPFSGVLTQALVNKGTLVSPGMKLGEFIDPGLYELQLSVNSAYSDLLKRGKTVELSNIEKTKSWSGKVVRVNRIVDPASQTIQAFIHVRGKDLREGMFMEANIPAEKVDDAFEIDRKLLVDDNKVYVVRDSSLSLAEVVPVHFTDNTAIVKGLTNGTQVIAKITPGAYSGMRVKISN
ncbi:MAG: HlyD family efflux transporter periplasmic adaptor subunit, partial [Saprospiraceae bacterium]|nr:HlyD family efflux transporter periplasmic adaptor subunit [Saprospiraceae bacterium]